MTHRATRRFWQTYEALPQETRLLADRCFELLKRDLRHPSIQWKKVGHFWSARIWLHHRGLAFEEADDLIWFWIGSHAEYDRLVRT